VNGSRAEAARRAGVTAGTLACRVEIREATVSGRLVVDHLEADLDDALPELGRRQLAIASADLTGHAPLTEEEEGEHEAADAVERFVEQVEATLPGDARAIETIGGEAIVVGSDAAAPADWAVGSQDLMFEPPGEVRLKGFSDATELFVARPSDDDR
jgi:class 3 adenylate cyclase